MSLWDMTRAQIDAALKRLDLSPDDAYRLFGVGRSTAWRWVSSTNWWRPPHTVELFLMLLLTGQLELDQLRTAAAMLANLEGDSAKVPAGCVRVRRTWRKRRDPVINLAE